MIAGWLAGWEQAATIATGDATSTNAKSRREANEDITKRSMKHPRDK
jgi:hypothetical protein